MKNVKRISGVLVIAVLLLTACVKEETPELVDETFVPTSADSFVLSGVFQDAPSHDASGTVKVYDNGTSRTLAFKDFKGDNGPDLRVYLATNTSASDFVELGKLKAVQGNFDYRIADGVDLTVYHTVLIWCEDFSVNFGSAVLQ